MRALLTSRIASGILTVLAIAAIAFVVRGALGTERAATPKVSESAKVASAKLRKPSRFSLRAAGHNVVPPGAVTIATARKRALRVYAKPKGKRSKRLPQRVFNGQRIPLTFLVRDRRKGWVHVDLPTRPNQSRGWLRRKDVDLSFTGLSVKVFVKAHRLQLLQNGTVITDTKIAVGESLSPTPPGRYYVTDIVKAKDPKGFFGPYSLGLSAHSTVYTSFEGGDGQVGIHGTNQPAAIGTDVSHGCIRVRNDVVRRLAARVPLGTPVDILTTSPPKPKAKPRSTSLQAQARALDARASKLRKQATSLRAKALKTQRAEVLAANVRLRKVEAAKARFARDKVFKARKAAARTKAKKAAAAKAAKGKAAKAKAAVRKRRR